MLKNKLLQAHKRLFNIFLVNKNLWCRSGSLYRYSTGPQEARVSPSGSSLELRLSAGSPLLLDLLWLRDHCRCSACFNATTHQRALSFLDIPEDVTPRSCHVKEEYLYVHWSDGHESRYSTTWLAKLWDPKLRARGLESLYSSRELWPEHSPPAIPTVSIEEFSDSVDAAAAKVLGSLLKFGMCAVTKVPATPEATQDVIERMFPMQRTFFGDLWQFGAVHVVSQAHQDTAYSQEALDPHHDSTYFTESTGLQIFHNLGRSENASGGATLLVDGMAAVEALRRENPEDFHLLASTAIESEYFEPGKHYLATQPVIVMDPLADRVLQVRFNLYDRAPMRTLGDAASTRRYYMALRSLSRLMLEGRFGTQLTLSPGTMLLIDNWRVMHGRTAFTGQRHMCGCYIGRGDWLSKARVLGLLS